MSATTGSQGDDTFRQTVLACTHELNNMLSELQERYGTGAVVAAVIDVSGCSMCAGDKTSQYRGDSLRALIGRLESRRVPP